MLSLEKFEKKECRAQIKEIEEKIWLDIFHARRSQALNDIFLERLRKAWGADFNRSLPMIYAISNAAIDSVVIALGRLLKPTAKNKECTLAIYQARVISYLDKYGPVLSESSHAKDSLKKLKDKSFVRQLRKRQEAFEKQIMPWRNKRTAHSETGPPPAFPKNLSMVITYVENVHKICYSVMEDAGGPGLYSTESFEKVSDYWCKCLAHLPQFTS